MAKPAARVGDSHSCRVMTPIPHVGGPILIPGHPSVLIGGEPAVTVGSLCECTGEPELPNSIVSGSSTVFICGAPAARVTDKTLHEGTITSGESTVLIGDCATLSSPIVYSEQSYENCTLQCIVQIIHQARGHEITEEQLFNYARGQEYCDATGWTDFGSRQQLFTDFVGNTNHHHISASSPNSGPAWRAVEAALTEALVENKGILAMVDAGALWRSPNARGAGHGVVVTEGDFDASGHLTHVFFNDTGLGQQGKRMGKNRFIKAMFRPNVDGTTGYYQLHVTENPIWTHIATRTAR